MKRKAEPMTTGEAVFNCHVNRAFDRAKDRFVSEFGQRTWDKHLQPFVDRGIMSVFQKKPNNFTRQFVNWIAEFVNEPRVKKGTAVVAYLANHYANPPVWTHVVKVYRGYSVENGCEGTHVIEAEDTTARGALRDLPITPAQRATLKRMMSERQDGVVLPDGTFKRN